MVENDLPSIRPLPVEPSLSAALHLRRRKGLSMKKHDREQMEFGKAQQSLSASARSMDSTCLASGSIHLNTLQPRQRPFLFQFSISAQPPPIPNILSALSDFNPNAPLLGRQDKKDEGLGREKIMPRGH